MEIARPYEQFLAMIERNLNQVGPGPQFDHLHNVESGIRNVLGSCGPDKTLWAAADHLCAEARKAAAGGEHDSHRAFEAFKQALAQCQLSGGAGDIGSTL